MEIIQTFEIEQIIADTLWIYETYPIFGFVVKLDARKMQLWENKKGESTCLDTPF